MAQERPKDDLIGRTLGQFEIIEEIGRGGMATVYRGRQRSMNRIVAVKVLPRHLLHDPGFYERFEREVDVIAHLEHPHILPIFDYGQDDGIPYIAMRYLGGGSLEQVIRRGGPKPLEELEKPMRQIALALDHAHRQGIIHRDLKPGNIMLDEAGNAYLSDFGIARVLGSEMTGSMIIGTPAYMSPEQANGLPIDGRADIYSLGVVLFELITGREPYQAETPMAVLLKHINEPMPPISLFREGTSDAVQSVVDKATAKDPTTRFSSASEMAEAFAGSLRGESVAVPPTRSKPSTMRPALIEEIDADTRTLSSTQQLQTRRRAPLLLIAGAILILAVAGVGGAYVLNQQNPTPVPPPNTSAIPTPFRRADTIGGDLYTLSMFEEWLIPPQGFQAINTDDPDRITHLWREDDNTAFVTLSIVQGADIRVDDDFQTAIEEYDEEYYQPQADDLALIDEAVAEDGTVRRSYRRAENGEFPAGQIDVFYIRSGTALAVLETYAAYATGNTHIETFQAILDSLRLRVS